VDRKLIMAYISLNNGYTYGIRTLANRPTTGLSAGETFFCTDNNRVMTYDGTFWVCDDFVVMVNRSGVTLNQWDLVIVQQGGTSTEISCVRTTTSGNPLVVGVVVYQALNGANCVIAVKGNYRVAVSSATSLGADLTTSATSGSAQTNAGIFSKGVFGFATSSTAGAGQVDCIIMARKELV